MVTKIKKNKIVQMIGAPHRTSEGRVPQQHHITIHESPPKEDGRPSSIKLALASRVVLRTSPLLCNNWNFSITPLIFLLTS